MRRWSDPAFHTLDTLGIGLPSTICVRCISTCRLFGAWAPAAAASVGVGVVRVRLAAVTLGGAICGLGGVALAFDQHQFQSGMSGGRGFIALAAVILSGWRPGRAVAACLAFAALDAAQILVQDQARAASGYFAQMMPYVATLLALWAIARRRGSGAIAGRPPAGLGKAED